jgi:hypothetical protein
MSRKNAAETRMRATISPVTTHRRTRFTVLTSSGTAARRRLRPSAEGPPLYAIGGALPILAVAVFVNVEYWTAFLPNRTFLGLPHGLEFIIGRGVFAPIGMLAGLAVVAVVRRIQS